MKRKQEALIKKENNDERFCHPIIIALVLVSLNRAWLNTRSLIAKLDNRKQKTNYE